LRTGPLFGEGEGAIFHLIAGECDHSGRAGSGRHAGRGGQAQQK
jgi:hypothetical protein